MGQADFWDAGNWNARCSMCGAKRKATQLVKNWQGMWRCPVHNEPRHPQDFVRAVPDVQTPPWVQGINADTFINTEMICTESSDTDDFDPMIYICTETLYPLEVEG